MLVGYLGAHNPLFPEVTRLCPAWPSFLGHCEVHPWFSALISVDTVALAEDVIQAIRYQSGFPGSGWNKVNPLAQQCWSWRFVVCQLILVAGTVTKLCLHLLMINISKKMKSCLGLWGKGEGSIFSVFFPVFSWRCPGMLCASSGFRCLG